MFLGFWGRFLQWDALAIVEWGRPSPGCIAIPENVPQRRDILKPERAEKMIIHIAEDDYTKSNGGVLVYGTIFTPDAEGRSEDAKDFLSLK
ncbi:hypothetical protein SUGI_0217820 [Cryptomeria japonica]|nr:hypothetical protein SUGI_0217820 [Cryptomeria japonica]